MGKVYEASSLLAYAKERVSTYKKLNEELGDLKKALQSVANLDTEFQGKGADQIKHFYQMQVDVVGYWEALVSANHAYFSVLSEHAHEEKLDGHTIVDVSFLEHELEVANNQATQMIEEQHKDLKDILQDSVILSDELKNAGIIRPKNSQAHHIVPVNDGGMREYLEKYGIDINSAANGVFITAKEFKFWPGQVVHHLYGDYWLTGKSFWGHGKAYKKHLDVELRRIDSLNISPLMKKDLILELLEDTREGLFTGRIDFLYKN
ncbi:MULTISPECIES: T7SS effector LXG polymorphic toxin [Priestia]|uniref:T7SS effector LXG polymorphic toxin n=1 Tax=Priestia TaxID=2800373 RepID=UPI0021F47D86|nr:T7SS effector LXG polymorphic toxin [Priestia megaterium]UYP10344.1 T7SS effector LXG polymorphic toxin [Priestia megaterium]